MRSNYDLFIKCPLQGVQFKSLLFVSVILTWSQLQRLEYQRGIK